MASARGLRAGLVGSAFVSAVVMTTLVVGPFYLSRALQLGAAQVGLVLSVGPLVAAFMGVPAGRMTDRFGAERVTLVGLMSMAVGALVLASLPARFGIAGYLGPIVAVTIGYALFQTANNTAVMRGSAADQRGVVAGMLNLARNLGLITGASVMGAVFAAATGAADSTAAEAAAVATGMRTTFFGAAGMIVAAIVVHVRAGGPARSLRPTIPPPIRTAISRCRRATASRSIPRINCARAPMCGCCPA